ncbi:MAG: hypothetical protein GPJ54_01920 [Candidatus Heimdallarchaeota archaeon]|nr:hypothetical protein [Candidatus Heimdallarchaeota archaeon]
MNSEYRQYKGYTFYWNSKILYNDINFDDEDSEVLELDSAENIVYTLPNSGNHLEEIFKLVQHGIDNNESIFLSSFVLNYEPVVEKLLATSDKLRGKIYILTVFNRNDIRSVVRSPNEENAHFTSLQRLVNAGIRVRNNPNGHWKFVVVGDRSIVTSANLTAPAFGINPEFGLSLPPIHSINLKKWFIDVWKYHTDEERRDTSNHKLPSTISQHSCILSSYGSALELISTYDNIKHKNKLMGLLGNSKASIWLTSYKLTNRDIIDMLNRKADDGIDVKILLPRSSYFRNDKYQAIKLLSDKIKLKYCLEAHCKIIIIDGVRVIVSTGNMDKHLNKPNLDISIFTKNQTIISSTSDFFEKLWNLGYDKIDEENITPGSWKDSLSLKILIDSPLRIHPRLYTEDLEGFVEKIQCSSLISVYHEVDDLIYLKFPPKTERQDILKLVKIDNGYRIQPLVKNEWEILNNLDVTLYETIEFELVWNDFLRE